jgi:hypothetical protein
MECGGVQGAQLLPARQSPSRKHLGVGSALGPCQVHASPMLLHKHQGAESVLGCVFGHQLQAPTDSRETGLWGVDASLGHGILELQGSHSSRNKSHLHKSHGNSGDMLPLLLNSFFSSIHLGRG